MFQCIFSYFQVAVSHHADPSNLEWVLILVFMVVLPIIQADDLALTTLNNTLWEWWEMGL